jgi:uncharacterized protein (DUF1330 family)
MSVYIINNMVIRDPEEYAKYARAFLPLFLKHGGEVLAVQDDPKPLEGSWAFSRTVLLRMPSAEKAREWYESDEYKTMAKHRWASTDSNVVILPAFVMPGAKGTV